MRAKVVLPVIAAILILGSSQFAFAQTSSDPKGEFPISSTSGIPVEVLGIQATALNVLAGTGGGLVTEWMESLNVSHTTELPLSDHHHLCLRLGGCNAAPSE